jgi:hypothetical protein
MLVTAEVSNNGTDRKALQELNILAVLVIAAVLGRETD